MNAVDKFIEMDGKQMGNPDKVAAVLSELVNNPVPPVSLFLGSDAYNGATDKISQLSQHIEQWKSLSLSTDFE